MPAIPLLTVLSNIPWGQVIDNAPKIAEGAGKLWNAVSKRGKATQKTPATAPGTEVSALPQDVRMSELEGQVAQLQEQMQASSELIQALANQNAQLILEIEQSRAKLKKAVRNLMVLGLALGAAVLYLYLRA